MANIVRGEGECSICHETRQELFTFIQTKWQCFIVFYTNLIDDLKLRVHIQVIYKAVYDGPSAIVFKGYTFYCSVYLGEYINDNYSV